jgi:hypothetical protein
VLLALVVLALAWAAIVAVTGGVQWRIAGLLFRSRDPARPFQIGLGLLLVYAVVFRHAFAHAVDRASAILRTGAPLVAALLAALLGAHGIANGTFTAGGSDSYGYVSQAYGWASGHLPQRYALPLTLPSPYPDQLQVPLGYTVSPEPHTMAPTYAPGLPLLMAAAVLVAGAIGPFLVVPACAALYVWLTFSLGRHVAGRSGGVIAALLLATSPVVLFQTVWPMSDVPAGALWTAAALSSLRPGRAGASISGLCSMAGLLVRPNLLPLALVPLAQVVLNVPNGESARGRERIVRALLFIAPIVPAALLIATLNAQWYGAPTTSGYGPSATLYSAKDIWPNVQRYGRWLWESQSPWILLAAVPVIPLPGARLAPGPLRLSAAMFVMTLCCYLAYFPFDAWWYLRFLLPGLGAFFVLLAAAIVTVARCGIHPWGRLAAVVILVLMTRHVMGYAIAKGVFGPLKEAERRYVYVGEFIRHSLPANALVLSFQHSGSIRFYSGRMTLRYDWIPPQSAPTVAPDLERLGYHPYLAIDEWETPQVRKQFNLSSDGPLPWRLVARMRDRARVDIFDMSPTAGTPARPIALEAVDAPLYSAPQPLAVVRSAPGS